MFKRNSALPLPSEKPDKTICSLTSKFPHGYYDTKLKFSKHRDLHVFSSVMFPCV